MSADLRQRIAAAIWEDEHPGHAWMDAEWPWKADALAGADAVLPVVQPDLDQLRAELEQARATVQRLNHRAQQSESTVATITRAVRDWQFTERGTYVPLRSLAAIARVIGRPVPDGRFELHHQRVEQLERDLDRTRAELAQLAEDTRYLLDYDGPRHAHLVPGVWDHPRNKPCTHCSRIAEIRARAAAVSAPTD